MLVTDDQLESLRKGPDGGVFESGLPVYRCGDCGALFHLYVPRDLLEGDPDFDELWSVARSIRESRDPRQLRPWDVDLSFRAEVAHGNGDDVMAGQYMRLVVLSLTGDDGLEDAMDAMIDDGDIGAKLDLGRWLLETLSRFEVIPSGIWDVYTDAVALHERGDDEAAAALMDRLIRTADDRLIHRWKETLKYTKGRYRSSKRYLDRESRKRVEGLMREARSLGAVRLTLFSREALRLVRKAHEVMDSI
jgi:hypothetical protein